MAAMYCYEVLTLFSGHRDRLGQRHVFNVLLVTIFALVPHATRMGQHISISLLVELVPSLQTALRIFAGLFGVAVCLLAAG